MENQKQKKSVGTIALVVLLLIVTIASLVLATWAWAKYTSKESSSAEATVAKWNVDFTPDNSTFVGHYNHVVDTKIAPGTEGTFNITVVPNNTEVCFNYTIKIDSVEFYNGSTLLTNSQVLDDNGTPTDATDDITLGDFISHIKFYDNNNVDITDGSHVISGTYNLTDHTANSTALPGTVTGTNTVTWKWPYQLTTGTDEEKAEYDRIDTAAGKYADSTNGNFKMKVNYTATAVQVNPASANH